MASKLYQIMFQIAGKVQSSFGSSFANAQKQLASTNGSIGRLPQLSNAAGRSVAGIGRQIGSLALKVGSLVGAGIGIKDMISIASDSQQKLAQMDAVLKSTGGAAGMSKQALLQLAAAQGTVTKFSKNTNIETENMLLTFTGINKNVFPATLQAANDMATAMGTDTKSAALTLGKALNDPAAGMTKLTKQGVTFTEAQKKQIKAMVAAKNVAGAQAIMLKELQREFGGSAAAAGKTFSGQLTILNNQIKNVGGGIASVLMPHLTNLVSKINQNMPKIQATITNIINKAQPYIKKFADEAFKIGSSVMPKIGKAITEAFSIIGPHIKPIINDLIKIVSNLLPSFGAATGKAKGPVVGLVKGGLDLLQKVLDWIASHGEFTKKAVIGIVGAFLGFRAISKTVSTINNVKRGLDSFHTAIGNVKSGFDTVRLKGMYFQDALKKVGSSGLNGAKALGKLTLSIVKTGAEFAKAGIKAAAYGIKLGIQKIATLASAAAEKILQGAQAALNFVMNLNPITLIIIAIVGLIAAGVLLYKNWDTVKAKASELWKGIKNAFSPIGKFITGVFQEAWNGIKAFLNFAIGGINLLIGGLNHISIKAPSWLPGIGGKQFGLSIPKIPTLANGGYINHKPGGILANIGEGSEDEVVSPISKLENIINGSSSQRASFTYAPQIIIQGNASKDDITQALSISKTQFKKLMDDYNNGKDRLSFNQS